MNCRGCQELISDFLGKRLDRASYDQVEEHVQECKECAAELEKLKELELPLEKLWKAAAKFEPEEEPSPRAGGRTGEGNNTERPSHK